jgi:MoaA/NifB/PqqE/SkfB family radical SAM enzyme
VYSAEDGSVRIVRDAFRKVYVESTSHCNLDCPMCLRHGWEEPLGHMPLERFARVLEGLPEDARDPVTVAFGGFGEPLMHPSWRQLLAVTAARHVRAEIITNGSLVDGESAEAIIALGVSRVTVSVDGGDHAAYFRMRGVPRDAALGAVNYLLQARLHTRRPVAIGVAAVATRSSVGSLPALLEWASDLKLDFISISNVVPHTEEMAGEILWDRAGWASVFRPSAWRPQVSAGRFDTTDATRPLVAALAEGGLTYPSPFSDDVRWRNRCRFAHEGICAVAWDGRVAPCLSLLHSHREYVNGQARGIREFIVGHLDNQPLPAIWRSSGFQSFRQRVRTFDFPPCFHCGGCPLTETNEADCYANPAPVCGECPWAQGIVLCP